MSAGVTIIPDSEAQKAGDAGKLAKAKAALKKAEAKMAEARRICEKAYSDAGVEVPKLK